MQQTVRLDTSKGFLCLNPNFRFNLCGNRLEMKQQAASSSTSRAQVPSCDTHLLVFPLFFSSVQQTLKTVSQFKSFCVKTNLLFYSIKNLLNPSHTTMSLVPFQRVWRCHSWVQCPVKLRLLLSTTTHAKQQAAPCASTRLPYFLQMTVLNHLHHTV